MNYFHRIAQKAQHLRDLRRPRQTRIVVNYSGQAMIEYLLMIVVTVVLVVGLTIAFFAPLQNFLAALNRTYIRCLLETGELPRVGTESTGICDAEIPKFQAKNMDGSTPNPKDKNKDGSGGSENNNGESSSADGSTGTEVSGGPGSLSGSRGRKSSLIRNGMRRKGGARPELGHDNKSVSIPVDNFEAGEGFMSASVEGGLNKKGKRKSKKIDLSGLMEYDRRKVEREKEKSRTIAVDSESFTQKKNKKLIVKPPPEKKAEEDLNVGTDFGSYFKIFFFIIIVLFIVILVVSQAMQMTNNSDG